MNSMSQHSPDYLSLSYLKKLSDDSRARWESKTPGRAPRSTRTCRPIAKGRFIKGPIYLNWLLRAARLPGRAPVLIALALLYKSGVQQDDSIPIKVTNPLAEEFGVARKRKYTALKALEKAGLIRVEQGVKKSPKVTILKVETEATPSSKAG
jgi:hypothetical protein